MKKDNIQNQVHWIIQEKYGGKLTPDAKRDIARLKKGEPVDYIIGFVDFLGCHIDLSKKPLIPRLETEFWVEKALDELKNRKPYDFAQGKIFNGLKILDMFAGSGCVGVAILKQIKNAHVAFADSEKNTLEQVKINCNINHIHQKRYKVVQSDIFENIKGKYDYIFANPPYIPTKRKHRVQPSALKHEPHTALFGGVDGLFFIRKFLAEAKNFLNPDGKIYMEFDSIQKIKIEGLLKKFKYKKFEFHKDQFGRWRYLVAS